VNSGTIKSEVDDETTGFYYTSASTTLTYNDNQWHLLVFTRSGPTITVYVDGTSAASGTGAGTANISNNYPFSVGNIDCAGSSQNFIGQLDEIKVWNYALNAQEMTVLARVPDAPSIVGATPGYGTAYVTFTPSLFNGGSGITGYTVTSSPGGITAKTTSTASTAYISGLNPTTTYTFTVTATNTVGTSASSSASNSITPNVYLKSKSDRHAQNSRYHQR
jgi:hypothetical protein